MRNWLGFDPADESAPVREAVRQLLSGRPESPFDLAPSAMASVFIPMDVLDMGPEIVVRANLPGLAAEDISVTYLDNTLTIKGETKEDAEYKGATYLRRERRATNFVRSVSLPVALDSEAAEAQFENGVLTLRIPKSEKIRPKSIKINRAA